MVPGFITTASSWSSDEWSKQDPTPALCEHLVSVWVAWQVLAIQSWSWGCSCCLGQPSKSGPLCSRALVFWDLSPLPMPHGVNKAYASTSLPDQLCPPTPASDLGFPLLWLTCRSFCLVRRPQFSVACTSLPKKHSTSFLRPPRGGTLPSGELSRPGVGLQQSF